MTKMKIHPPQNTPTNFKSENIDITKTKPEGSLGPGMWITGGTLKPSYGFSIIENRKIKQYEKQEK